MTLVRLVVVSLLASRYADASHLSAPLNLLIVPLPFVFVAPLWCLLSTLAGCRLASRHGGASASAIKELSPRIYYEAHDHCQGDNCYHPPERNGFVKSPSVVTPQYRPHLFDGGEGIRVLVPRGMTGRGEACIGDPPFFFSSCRS